MAANPVPKSVYVDFVVDKLPAQEALAVQTFTADEMDDAEHNFDVVLNTATRIESLRLLPGFKTTTLENVIRDLKVLFTLVRRTMNERKDCRNYLGTKPVAPIGQKGKGKEEIPQNLRQGNVYHCLCPLTLLLQLIAQGLNELNIRFRSMDTRLSHERKEQEIWGALMPLRGMLVKMEGHFKRAPVDRPSLVTNQTSDVCPGLATIIMFHEKNSQYTVTATAPRYLRLTGLQKYAFKLRDSYINERLMENLPPETVERIRELERYSQAIKVESLAARKRRQNPIDPGGFNPHYIGGNNASLGNAGNFRAACLMDHWRFKISRPELAQAQEDTFFIAKRMAFEVGSCAEWELYVTILANPDPEHPRPPPPAIRRDDLNGTPKPPTWEKTAYVNERVGVVKNATFASNPPPRHPAIHQIVTPPPKHYPQQPYQMPVLEPQADKTKVKKRSCWGW